MTVQRLVSQEATAGEMVARVLAEAGIDMVFGISGGHTGRIFAGLEKQQNSVRTVLVREESLGGVMAEVYGRLRRLPGVLIGQGPWVLGNGLLGTLEAHLSSSPMLLLTDFSDPPNLALHAPYQSGAGDYGAWDARRAFGGVTKQVFQALDPSQAVQATQLAIKHAMAGQMGPVAVIFSFAALNGRVGPDTVPPLYPTQLYMPPPAIGADARARGARRAGAARRQAAGDHRRQRRAHGAGLRGAQGNGRGARHPGRHQRVRQGHVRRDARSRPRRLRHVRHGDRQRHRQWSRRRARGRLEARRLRHGARESGAPRSDAPDLHPDRHRAEECLVDVSGRACAHRRRRHHPAAIARGDGRGRQASCRRDRGGCRAAGKEPAISISPPTWRGARPFIRSASSAS